MSFSFSSVWGKEDENKKPSNLSKLVVSPKILTGWKQKFGGSLKQLQVVYLDYSSRSLAPCKSVIADNKQRYLLRKEAMFAIWQTACHRATQSKGLKEPLLLIPTDHSPTVTLPEEQIAMNLGKISDKSDILY